MTEGNTEIFPQIKEVVHPRLVVPGMEFMYVRTKNLRDFTMRVGFRLQGVTLLSGMERIIQPCVGELPLEGVLR
jgi:hypothetical protein